MYTNDCTSKDPSVKLLKFADDTTLISFIQDGDESVYRQEVKELADWCSLNNLELNTLKTVEITVDFRRTPPALPPLTIMDSSMTAVESFRFLAPSPQVGDLHWLHCEKGPAEAVLPSPAEEVQPATGAAETVLLRHHWIHPLHFNNCLVQLSYQIWPQKTTEVSPDCWTNHWYTPPHSPKNCTNPQWAKGLAKSLWTPHIQHTPHSLFELLPSGQRYRALSTRTTRHRNSFFPQAIISWTLDNNCGTHTIYTLIYLKHILSLHYNCT